MPRCALSSTRGAELRDRERLSRVEVREQGVGGFLTSSIEELTGIALAGGIDEGEVPRRAGLREPLLERDGVDAWEWEELTALRAASTGVSSPTTRTSAYSAGVSRSVIGNSSRWLAAPPRSNASISS